MRGERKCCGNCAWHDAPSFADGETDWRCDNEKSDAYGCITEYDDSCSDWEDSK